MNKKKEANQKKFNLFVTTGHELQEPENQFCKHCKKPMFITRHQTTKCKGRK